MKQIDCDAVDKLYQQCGINSDATVNIRTELNTGWHKVSNSYYCNNNTNNTIVNHIVEEKKSG